MFRKRVALSKTPQSHRQQVSVPGDGFGMLTTCLQQSKCPSFDPCTQLSSCSACIGSRFGNISCGWCMGGTIHYNSVDSGSKCGGFEHGQPLPFSCNLDFRTEDCTGKLLLLYFRNVCTLATMYV